jgi:hypothetical protein
VKATPLLLVLIFLAAACGGSGAKPMTNAAYVEALASIGTTARHGAAFKPVCMPKEPSASDSYAIRFRVHSPAPETLIATASALSKLHPPAAAATAQRDLVEGLRSAGTALLPLTKPGGCKGINARTVFNSLAAAIRQTQRAHNEFQHAGFKLPSQSLTT